MPSLEAKFKELQLRLQDNNRLRNTGGDPVFYLVFPPEEMLRVKRRVKAWKAQLSLLGWDVEVLSLARLLDDFFKNHSLRRRRHHPGVRVPALPARAAHRNHRRRCIDNRQRRT